MKKKLYFESEDSELCHTIDYFIDKSDPDQNEITVYVAEPTTIDGYFWCKAVGEVGENGGCGKSCNDYEPKNGKSGMCRFKGKFYTHGQKTTIKLKL